MYHTIIVPTDGSDTSLRAAEQGLAFARRYEATVHVISVVDVQRAAGIFGAGGIDEAFVDRVEAVGQDAVAAVGGLATDDDLHTAVVRGPPWKVPSVGITEYAVDNDADLIVMGTHGRTGVRRALAGSVTERVVRMSPVPVLIVGATNHDADRDADDDTERGTEVGYDRVLVPTDGSDGAAIAIDHALSIARRYDAVVHALFVVDATAVATTSDVAPYTVVREKFEAEGDEATAAIAIRAEAAGLDAVRAVREGHPSRTVRAYATEAGIDLIVMGTHGRTGLDRLLLGSTAARVFRRAPVPVLVVTPSQEDSASDPTASEGQRATREDRDEDIESE